jgi:hypothetical protein
MSDQDKSRIPSSDIAVNLMQQEQSIPGVANTIDDIRAAITSECCDQLDILDRYLKRGQVWRCKMNAPHHLLYGGDNEKHHSLPLLHR